MILIVDFLCKEYSHEIFNAGTILQIAKANKDEKVLYYADEGNVYAVGKIFDDNGVNLCNVSLNGLTGNFAEKPKEFFCELFSENKDVLSVFITTFPYRYFLDLKAVVLNNPKINFFFFQHGQVEMLIDKYGYNRVFPRPRIYSWSVRGIEQSFYAYQSKWRYYKESYGIEESSQFVKGLTELAQCNNIRFIMFTKAFLKYKEWIPNAVLTKMITSYLPYVFKVSDRKSMDMSEIVIGLMPSTVEDIDYKAIEVIKYVNKNEKRLTRDVKWLFFRHDTYDLKNAVVYENGDFDRCNMLDFFEKCDFLLLPFTDRKYKISCSGTLFDAIDSELPVLMLNSNCFEEFEAYNIGYKAQTSKELGEKIIEIVNSVTQDKILELRENNRKLKESLQNSNIELFKNLNCRYE